MRTFLAAFLAIALSSCSTTKPEAAKLSPLFSQEGKLAYQMTQAAESHQSVLKRDFDVQMLKAKASVSTEVDSSAMDTLNLYQSAWRYGEGEMEDNRVIDVCHEAARKIFDPMTTWFLHASDLKDDDLRNVGIRDCSQKWNELSELKRSPEWKAKVHARNVEKCKGWSVGLKPAYRGAPCPYLRD